MSVARYRKLPIPVEARQVPPSEDGQSGLDLAAWCGGSVSGTYAAPKVFVPTLEGDLVARVGDWIVKGPRGEFWPVKGAIFAETYEPVTEAADFFQPGRTYTASSHADLRFECLALDVDPDSSELVAVGWRFSPPHNGIRQHRLAALDAGDWACCDWADTTEESPRG